MATAEETQKIIVDGTKMAIESVVGNLEIITKTLDNKFPTLKVSSLPEYQSAIDAIRKYGEAVVKRMNEEYAVEMDTY